MRKMAYARKSRQVKLAERFSKSVGPGIWKERIMLRPAHTSGQLDRRQSRPFSLDHGDACLVHSFVVCKASLQVAGFKKLSTNCSSTSSKAFFLQAQ